MLILQKGLKMQKKSIFSLSFSDFFTKEFLLLAILPFVVSAGLFFGLYAILVDVPIVEGSFFTNIFTNLISMILYALGGIASVMLSLLSALVIIGFLTPYAVAIVHKRHYSEIKCDASITIMQSLIFLAKTFATFFILLILFTPLYFIPAVNALALQALFFYLFHTLLVFDVGTNIFNSSEYKIFKKKKYFTIIITNFVLFLLSQIPMVGLLIPLFTVIVITHISFRYKKEVLQVQ